MQQIYSKNPRPFHMYNLGKVDVYSEPCQIPKVDLFVIAAFNSALNSSLQNVVHNEYHVEEEILFLFAYVAFLFWSLPRFNDFLKF